MTAIEIADDSYSTSGRSSDERREQQGPPANRRRDKVASEVVERWKRGSDELLRQRRDFWQNLAFFMGEQWVWWDKSRNVLQAFPQDWSPLGPKSRARVVSNRVTPNCMSLLGRLLRSDLEFDVPPSDSADDVMAGAMLAEDVLNAQYREQDWREVRYDENFAKLIGGTSAVCVEWDHTAGTPITVDERTGQLVGTGDVTLTALNITEFVLQPGVREARKAQWWIMGLAQDPEYVKEHYQLNWKPNPDASMLLSPLQQKLLESLGRGQGTNQLCLVLTMYELPCPKYPEGRHVVVINDSVVHSGPYPFLNKDRLNVFVFRQQKIEGTWVGRTLMNDAIPIQTQYNFVRSIMAEHAKKVGNARITAPQASFDEEDLDDDPGSVLFYLPDGMGGKPEFMKPPELGRWLMMQDEKLKAELDDVMMTHPTSRGQASFDRASGQALALLSEKDDSPLALMAQEEAQRWGEIGSYVLELYEQRVIETRQVRVDPRMGQQGQPRITRWNGQRLRGQTRAFVPLDATMPVSQAAMHAFAKDLWDRQLLTDPVQFARIARLPQRELVDIVDADVARAQRENARIMEGVAVLPFVFDDHAKHIAEHNRFRKSDSYLFADDEIKRIADWHIQFHEQLAAEQAGQQAMRAGLNPALAMLPQGTEPPGSMVPPDFAEQMRGMAALPPGAASGNIPHRSSAPDPVAMQGGSVAFAAGVPVEGGT